jgi:hypothetical protein
MKLIKDFIIQGVTIPFYEIFSFFSMSPFVYNVCHLQCCHHLGLVLLSAREAEGRAEVHIFAKIVLPSLMCLKNRSISISLFYKQHNFPLSKKCHG